MNTYIVYIHRTRGVAGEPVEVDAPNAYEAIKRGARKAGVRMCFARNARLKSENLLNTENNLIEIDIAATRQFITQLEEKIKRLNESNRKLRDALLRLLDAIGNPGLSKCRDAEERERAWTNAKMALNITEGA